MIKYYFKASDYHNENYLLPENAPGDFFSLKVAYPADINVDDRIDIFDLLTMLEYLSTGNGECDINQDGRSDVFDILEMLKTLSAN